MENRTSSVWDASRLDAWTICLEFLLAFMALFIAIITLSYADHPVATKRQYGFTIAGCAVGAAFWLVLVPFVAAGGPVRAMVIGAIWPPLSAAISVVGVYIFFFILVYWSIFVPLGAAVGFLTWRITRKH